MRAQASVLHLDLDEFSRLAAQAPVGAEGLLMLPFFFASPIAMELLKFVFRKHKARPVSA